MTNDFPRAHRFTFTRWLLDAAFGLRERLEGANHPRAVRRGPFNNNHRSIACRRLQRLLAAYVTGEIPLEQGASHRFRQGWVNHVRHGDTWGLRRAVLAPLPCPHTPTPPHSF